MSTVRYSCAYSLRVSRTRDRKILPGRRCVRSDLSAVVRSPDERSDIRDHSHAAPDIAALIRATSLCICTQDRETLDSRHRERNDAIRIAAFYRLSNGMY
jgi:hypothetical protein